MNASRLRALFSHLVLVAAAPLGSVACGGVAVGPLGTVEPEPTDGGVPPTDAATPTDSGACTPEVAPTNCGANVTFPCGVVSGANGTPLPQATCDLICNTENAGACAVYESVSPGGTTFISCGPCGMGRRPAGLSPACPSSARDAVGAWLAAAAHLEAASVPAFEKLAGALARHGAPRTLVARARAAAKDEVRHARVTRDLARRRGGEAPAVVVRPTREVSLAKLAIENAVEGCVRETYAALVATWQAAHARDPEIRGAMVQIARDETRHAALSWDIDRWTSTQLTPADRARVDRARRAAARTLLNELAVEPPTETTHDAGVPTARVARTLAGALTRALV